MDLQAALTEAARLLLREGSRVSVDLSPHGCSGAGARDVRVSCEYGGKRLSGLAWDTSVNRAFLRALLELGEEVLKVREGMPSRSGLSAGVFRETAANRARGELVERDAFFFHYRRRIPFRHSGILRLEGTELDVFELLSAEESIKVALVCARSLGDSAAGEQDSFLHFATASSNDPASAALRAGKEYVSLRRYLGRNLERLLKRSESPSECEKDPTLLHLRACSDPRNADLFRNLVQGSRAVPEYSRGDAPGWRMFDLPSPVRGFQYVRAESPDLVKIQFGIPEIGGASPLYHPFW